MKPPDYGSGRYVPREQAVAYGVGAVRESLSGYLAEHGHARVVIVAGRSLSETRPIIDAVTGAVGRRRAETIVPEGDHAVLATVIETANQAREAAPDCVVSLGGGGIMDLGKGLAAALGLDLDTEDAFDAAFRNTNLLNEGGAPSAAAFPLPHVALPTTLAGAQHTATAGFVDRVTGGKRLYTRAGMQPQAVFLDPELTLATPARLWASTGLKALDHAVEKYYGVPPHPVIDAMALAAAPTIHDELPRSLTATGEDGLRCRLALLVAGWQAMFGSRGFFKSGLSHALGRQMGALCRVPHGITSCVTLPGVMAFNLAAAEDQLRALGAAFGLPSGKAAAGASEAVHALVERLDLPTRLRDTGMSRDALPLIARESMNDPAAKTNPRPVADAAAVESLLESMW